MSKKANYTAIGAFVIGAAVVLAAGIAVFGSGLLFQRTVKYVLFFDGSIKGLSVGAPVIFRGVKVGSVKDISLMYDQRTGEVLIPVIIEVESARVKGAPQERGYSDYRLLIDRGLRARLEIQSFLTGQLMLAFDFYPDKPARLRGIMKEYPELPALPISPDIFKMVQEIPLKEIAENLAHTVKGLDKLVNSEDLQESFLELKVTLKEISQTSRSLGLLVEYLEQHPEALLRGKRLPKGE